MAASIDAGIHTAEAAQHAVLRSVRHIPESCNSREYVATMYNLPSDVVSPTLAHSSVHSSEPGVVDIPPASREAFLRQFLCDFPVSGVAWSDERKMHVLLMICNWSSSSPTPLNEEITYLIARAVQALLPEFADKNRSCFRPILELAAKCMQDRCPDIQLQGCSIGQAFVSSLTFISALDATMMSATVSACQGNLTSRHWKVRKASLDLYTCLIPVGASLDKYDPAFLRAVCTLSRDKYEVVRVALINVLTRILQTYHAGNQVGCVAYILLSLCLDRNQQVSDTAISAVVALSDEIHEHVPIPASWKHDACSDPRILGLVGSAHMFLSHQSHVCNERAINIIRDHKGIDMDDDRSAAISVLSICAHLIQHGQAHAVITAVGELLAVNEKDGLSSADLKGLRYISSILSRSHVVAVVGAIRSAIDSLNFKSAKGLFRILREMNSSPNDEETHAVVGAFDYASTHAELAGSVVRVLVDVITKGTWYSYVEKITKIVIRCESLTEDEMSSDVDCISNVIGTKSIDVLYSSELLSADGPELRFLHCLVKRSDPAGAVIPTLPNLVNVLMHVVEENAVLPRLEVLEILHTLASRRIQLCNVSSNVIDGILCPLLQWQPGLANNKIRKVSLVCFRSLLRHSFLQSPLPDCLILSLSAVRSCMDDCWSPDNRLLSLLLAADIFKLLADSPMLGNHDDIQQLLDCNKELSRSLDDSLGVIRNAAACTFISFAELLMKPFFEPTKGKPRDIKWSDHRVCLESVKERLRLQIPGNAKEMKTAHTLCTELLDIFPH